MCHGQLLGRKHDTACQRIYLYYNTVMLLIKLLLVRATFILTNIIAPNTDIT